MNTIDINYQYFLNHQKELAKEFYGRYVVIKDQKVVGDYDSEIKAYLDAKKRYGLGNFIIQYCVPEGEERLQAFYSPIVEA